MNPYQGLLDYFSSYLSKKGKQKATIVSYHTDIKLFLKYLLSLNQNPLHVEKSHLEAYQDYLDSDKKKQPNSIRRKIISIRQFYRALAQGKFIKTTPLDDLPIPERFDKEHPLLEEGDIDLLLDVASVEHNLLKSCRDRAIISTLAFEGLKVSELIQLTWQDLIIHNQMATLRVTGTRSRVINLSEETHNLLKNYKEQIEKWDPYSLVSSNTSVFIAFKGRDTLNFSHKISRHGLKFLLYELGVKSGMTKIHTEMLRHHSIQFQMELGKNTSDIMDHLGLRQPGIIAKHFSQKGVLKNEL